MSKRILLMYISEVSGHHSATLAIESAIKKISKDAVVENVNSLSLTSPIGGRIIHYLYMLVIQRLPGFWGWMYDNPKVISFLEPIKKSLHQRKFPKIERLMLDYHPEVVVFSQAYPCGILAHYKKIKNLNIPLVAVLTDFAPHSYWVYDEVNYYIVPSEEARQKLIEKGVASSKIKFFGIPINDNFAQDLPKEEACKRLGLDSSLKTILLMGGGHGLGPLDEICKYLDDNIKENFQLIAVCGINKELVARLENLKQVIKKKLLVYSFVNNINELMDASDIIITKAGGLTTAEALAKGLGMIVVNSIPGQEINNTEFLVNNNLCVSANSLEDVAKAVKKLIEDSNELFNLRAKAKSFGRPKAAFEIAQFLLQQ